jgi:hypothetical protein
MTQQVRDDWRLHRDCRKGRLVRSVALRLLRGSWWQAHTSRDNRREPARPGLPPVLGRHPGEKPQDLYRLLRFGRPARRPRDHSPLRAAALIRLRLRELPREVRLSPHALPVTTLIQGRGALLGPHGTRPLGRSSGQLLLPLRRNCPLHLSPPRSRLPRHQHVHPGTLRVRADADGAPRDGDDAFDRDGSSARISSHSRAGRLNRHARQRAVRTTTRWAIKRPVNSITRTAGKIMDRPQKMV